MAQAGEPADRALVCAWELKMQETEKTIPGWRGTGGEEERGRQGYQHFKASKLQAGKPVSSQVHPVDDLMAQRQADLQG